MDIAVNLKVRSKITGLVSRLKVIKKDVSKAQAEAIVKEVKAVIPDPKAKPETKGKDRGQVVIKVDGKATLNQKFKGVNASLINVYTASLSKPPVSKEVKPEIKKPVAKKVAPKK